MRVFGTTDTVEQSGLAAQLRVKPAGIAAVWSGLRDFARRKPVSAAGGVVLVVVVLVAVFAEVIAPYGPQEIGVATKFAGPGTENALLGTDQLGRDILSRLIHGARISMYVGIVSVVIGITAGTIMGVVSAYVGGWFDILLQRLVDALMGFPPIILALGLMAALGASTNNVIIALVVILVPGATRVIRSQALSIKELDYTLAARSIGASSMRIIFKHMLPNVAATYIVLVTLTLGFAIVVEAALSFLGVGIPPDVATWGSMLELGRRHIDNQFWMVVFPGVVIALVVFSVNFLGDGLRDVMDPKLRGR
ncbi:MAG: ABC transporter permease [Chloroflexi bacterium]|nr:ABC transporter permease [Chloroflexota bacterium]